MRVYLNSEQDIRHVGDRQNDLRCNLHAPWNISFYVFHFTSSDKVHLNIINRGGVQVGLLVSKKSKIEFY